LMIILTCQLLIGVTWGRPQSPNTKIIFGTDDDIYGLRHDDCDHEKGMIYWLEDGQCYDIGERGPCNFGEVLWFIKKPTCIPENEVPSNITSDELCNEDGLVYWPENGLCYPLLTRGPCKEGFWLELIDNNSTAPMCAPQRCEDPEQQVFWPEICKCISATTTESAAYGPTDVCGQGSELAWGPFGEGVCICKDHFYADIAGNCFELGSQGPCKDGFIWGIKNASASCIVNDNEVRVFDLIPANNQNGLPKSRTTQTQRCHVDEKGRCRKTLNLKNRFGNSDSFADWLSSFHRRSESECKVPICTGDMAPWLDGKCYQLASTGPCKDDTWLVLDQIVNGEPIMKCKNKKCSYGIWWAESCSCVTDRPLLKTTGLNGINIQKLASPCAKSEQLLLNPYGEGICGCKDGFSQDEKGECHEIGKQGPCNKKEVFSLQGEIPSCVSIDDLSERIFDLIPENEDPSSRSSLSVGKATRKNCHVDELGKCRKTLNLRGRIDVESNETNVENLIAWFGTFEKNPDSCENRDECKEDTIKWKDEKCYHLASTGPCKTDEWLVLDSIVEGVPVIKCKKRKCAEGVWFSKTCSCINTFTKKAADATDTVADVCGPNEEALINPYGDGICACMDRHLRFTDGKCYKLGSRGPCQEGESFSWGGTKGTCEPSEIEKRIFDLIPLNNPMERSSPSSIGRATRQNCNVDELGKCRKTLNLRNRIEGGSKDDIVDWLVQFAKEDNRCSGVLSPTEKRKAECHREGKVLFEDGECYNLLERGPCFENAMWLVMSVEDGNLVPRCKHRRCLSSTGSFLTRDCQCYLRDAEDVCGKNEQLYDDILGNGICGCKPAHDIWDGDDTCYPLHHQGPCGEEEVLLPGVGADSRTECVKSNCSRGFVQIDDVEASTCFKFGDTKPCEEGFEVGVDPETLKAKCIISDERSERVFDLIPSNQNQANTHHGSTKITQETCVLDKRGRCRRKLVFRRGTHRNEALEFENWLKSFITRYDGKCM